MSRLSSIGRASGGRTGRNRNPSAHTRQCPKSACDGSKALRAAINAVFGSHQPVQRRRAHKLRKVLDYLPKDDKPQVKRLPRAAWKLDADRGIARIKKLAAWLEQKYPQAAASLLKVPGVHPPR